MPRPTIRGVALLAALGAAVFIVSALAGALSPESAKQALYGILSERVREIEEAVRGGGLLLLPLLIFSNNLVVSLIVLALFPTIVGPWAFMAFQGYATGAIIGYQAVDEGIHSLASLVPGGCTLSPSGLAIAKLALLIPHGVFEVAGVSLFFASSARLSIEFASYILWRLGKRAEKPSMLGVLASLALPIVVGVLLLAVAAVIESFITPAIGFLTVFFLCSRG